jgi:4-hydroxybenzoate polyprenyltransferase
MRPTHWVKNSFVVAAILFSGRFDEPVAWAQTLAAFLSFCLLSSAVYLLNDVCDRHRDRHHPLKRRRAVASGRLSPAAALSASAGLVVLGMALAVAVEAYRRGGDGTLGGWGLVAWAGGYLVLNVLYSLWLKHRAMLDVILVALGFVLRAMAGAAAIDAPISPWLVLCTFTLCLFIALTKRRAEILALDEGRRSEARRALTGYDAADVEQMLTVSIAMALITYAIYCVAPRTVHRVGSAHMIWTLPLVVYGVFRYNRITRRVPNSDPTQVLVRDRVMWAVIAAYLLVAALVVRYGGAPAVADLLESGP